MIAAKFKLTDPDQMEAVAEIRMTLREWRDLRTDLFSSQSYTSMSFRRVLDTLINRAESTFYAREESTKD